MTSTIKTRASCSAITCPSLFLIFKESYASTSARQPLPANPYSPGSLYSDAYIACVQMEAWAIGHHAQALSGPSVLVCARLLGYMIIHAPTHAGRDNISSEITSCRNYQEKCTVACTYIDHFVRCCECGITNILSCLLLIGSKS